MQSIFPKPILALSQAEVNLDGARLYLVNGENEQVVFMEFEKMLRSRNILMIPSGRLSLKERLTILRMELNILLKKAIGFLFLKESYILLKFMQVTTVLLFLIKKKDTKRSSNKIYFLFFIL